MELMHWVWQEIKSTKVKIIKYIYLAKLQQQKRTLHRSVKAGILRHMVFKKVQDWNPTGYWYFLFFWSIKNTSQIVEGKTQNP